MLCFDAVLIFTEHFTELLTKNKLISQLFNMYVEILLLELIKRTRKRIAIASWAMLIQKNKFN